MYFLNECLANALRLVPTDSELISLLTVKKTIIPKRVQAYSSQSLLWLCLNYQVGEANLPCHEPPLS